MGKVCAVTSCKSGTAADTRRRISLNLKKPAFFQVPKSPTRRQQWIDSLRTELTTNKFVCELHFPNAVQRSWVTNLKDGGVDVIEKRKATCTPGTIPQITDEVQSPVMNSCEYEVLNMTSPSHNPELQAIEEQFSNDEMRKIDNSEINLDNEANIINIIIKINKYFPIGWSFFPGSNKLTAIQFDPRGIQFDPIKLKERIRLVIDVDGSILVSFFECHKEKVDVQINTVSDLINCLKSMEKKILCDGTGFVNKSRSLKCCWDLTDNYKRCPNYPRCLECRNLRIKLQQMEKRGTKSKVNSLEHYKKMKRLQQQVQLSTSKLRCNQRKIKTIFESQFNKNLSLLPKEQQITVRMCFENAKKKGPTGRRYEVEWIYECLLIRMKSTCTYNMIRSRNIIPLPTVDTLTKYIQKISSSIFGFLSETFEILRKKGESMRAEEKVGQISADEVKLMENIEFNKQIAEYTGFVDLGKYTSDSQRDVAGDHALVFMYVPYRGNSAQPLGCFITKNSVTSEVLHKLFLECILLMENAGFHINSLVTDAAQWNRGVWTKLGIDTNNISCEHPCDPDRRLWMLSDFPHLKKNFRNALVELDEFETPVGLVKTIYWKNLLLVEQYDKPNLAMAHKLTPAHLNPKQYQKMSVPLAYQLYSREVRCAMTVLRESGNKMFEGSEPTEKFIKIIDDGIQAMTSHDANNALYFKDTCEKKKAIQTLLNFLEDWEKMSTPTKNPKTSTPGSSVPKKAAPKKSVSTKSIPKPKNPFPISASTISGYKVTLRATLEILSELHETYGYEYLLTSRLSQDNLERLFSIMRYCCGSNDHPTPQQFGQVFRLYCCNAMIKPPKGSNVTGVELLQTLMKTKDSLEISRLPRIAWLAKIDEMLENAVPPDEILIDNPSYNIDNTAATPSNSEPMPSTSYTTEEYLEDHDYDVVTTSREVQAYMAGYVVRKFQLKCKCLECLENLKAPENELNSRDRFIDLMEMYGGLSRASDDLFKLTMQLEAAFLDVVGRVGLSHGIIYKILYRIEKKLPQLHFVGCPVHKHERTKEIIDFYVTMRLHFLSKTFNKKNQLRREKMKTLKKTAKLL